MTDIICVVIADDHPLVRQGIRTTIENAGGMSVIGEVSHGDEAQLLCRKLLPDVLLLDLQMPGATAVETVTALLKYCPTVRVIVLTAYDDAVYVRRMTAVGVAGYVLKDEVAQVLVTAIRSVMQGGTWLSQCVLKTLAIKMGSVADPVKITERERLVLQRLAQGMTQEQIHRTENLSMRTVARTVARLLEKLGADSQFVLGSRAEQLGLIPRQGEGFRNGQAKAGHQW